MATRQKRGSRPGGAMSPEVPGTDRRLGTAALDGLLLRVARGDAAAFECVYDQVAGAVYGLVSRIVGDQSRAEQVTAEVLVEVWRSAPRFSAGQDSGLSWVIAIAQRRAMNQAGTAG
jgi:RNA polymerase sigma-70 factor, ECF subfamily